jgi:hypothetical protein
MKKPWVVLALACLVALPALGGDPVLIEDPDDPKDPHRALREAVEDIRIHYAPNAGFAEDFVLSSSRLNRPGLGIIIAGGWSSRHVKGMPGAEILAVTPGSPADEAGLQPGDLVVSWNGEPLVEAGGHRQHTAAEASRELAARSRTIEEGEAVTLGYFRDGRQLEATLVARTVEFGPSALPGRWVRPAPDVRVGPGVGWTSAEPWFLPRGWLDMELVEINPELGEYFGTDTGVLVVRGPEKDEALGIQSGDVILRIGEREVTSPEHAMRILRSYDPDETLSVDIIRRGHSQTLTGTVPESSFRFHYRFGSSGQDE